MSDDSDTNDMQEYFDKVADASDQEEYTNKNDCEKTENSKRECFATGSTCI